MVNCDSLFFSCLIMQNLVLPGAQNDLAQQNYYDIVCIKSKSTLCVCLSVHLSISLTPFFSTVFGEAKNDLSSQTLLEPITESLHISTLIHLHNKGFFPFLNLLLPALYKK